MDIDQMNPVAAKLASITGDPFLGGRVPVKAGDKVIGAAGFGGAPAGNLDEPCVMAALEQAKDQLK